MRKNQAVLSKSAHEYLTYLDVLTSANVTIGNEAVIYQEKYELSYTNHKRLQDGNITERKKNNSFFYEQTTMC